MTDYFYWFALKSVPLVGNVTFRRLVAHFGSPKMVLESSAATLTASKTVSRAVAQAITSHNYRSFAEKEAAAVEKLGIKLITFQSELYPPLLLEIPDPPPYLYLKGSLEQCEPAIAIVGSRSATSYGLQAANRLATELAEQGVTVVSGMARGIDTAAHKGALAGGGKSIGVLGCGIDVVYPAENRRLFDEMAESGALVSEFPLGTGPLANNFPRRNRIISGLSVGVLVVEAAARSGSLITAQFALEQGRDVFAIPGSITSGASRGTNSLIKQGAKLVETVSDILEELPSARGRQQIPFQPKPVLLPGEEAILSTLGEGPAHIDEIARKAGLTVQELSVILLRLELRGIVIQLPGKLFSRS
ncbi:DNA-processing protein DprA [Geobacter pelophilus]|uniref:DNA-processing protein DprA n=1 Tax=Geoanaerobacter pelophilus TaxID=60036 RepID=A0AAW4L5K5_9BACT|nr:DNA-processing protein DprA [Geoanaerobacter pelophilus]MBT0666258.1 DNA-processing protein DprA [Geoanaerobacter pelophilus]